MKRSSLNVNLLRVYSFTKDVNVYISNKRLYQMYFSTANGFSISFNVPTVVDKQQVINFLQSTVFDSFRSFIEKKCWLATSFQIFNRYGSKYYYFKLPMPFNKSFSSKIMRICSNANFTLEFLNLDLSVLLNFLLDEDIYSHFRRSFSLIDPIFFKYGSQLFLWPGRDKMLRFLRNLVIGFTGEKLKLIVVIWLVHIRLLINVLISFIRVYNSYANLKSVSKKGS